MCTTSKKKTDARPCVCLKSLYLLMDDDRSAGKLCDRHGESKAMCASLHLMLSQRGAAETYRLNQTLAPCPSLCPPLPIESLYMHWPVGSVHHASVCPRPLHRHTPPHPPSHLPPPSFFIALDGETAGLLTEERNCEAGGCCSFSFFCRPMTFASSRLSI